MNWESFMNNVYTARDLNGIGELFSQKLFFQKTNNFAKNKANCGNK